MAEHYQELHLSDDHRLAYRRSPGAGPGIVFLGGYRSDMSGTKAVALERWCQQQKRAYLRFDYRGHGASSGRFEDGTVSCWTNDALAVIDRLTNGPQILVGSSMGGWIMLLTALARPQRVFGLVGVATAADFTEDVIWANLDRADRDRLARDGVIHRRSTYADEPDAITLKIIEDGRRHLLLREAIALDCPVRLLHGLRDAEVPWQTSVRVAERLRGNDVRVVLIKEGEHRLSRTSDLNLLCGAIAELGTRATTD